VALWSARAVSLSARESFTGWGLRRSGRRAADRVRGRRRVAAGAGELCSPASNISARRWRLVWLRALPALRPTHRLLHWRGNARRASWRFGASTRRQGTRQRTVRAPLPSMAYHRLRSARSICRWKPSSSSSAATTRSG
jgi:hypothetical protein